MLKQIVIKKFRSCHSVVIDFPEPVCAIVGKNGVGKTNVLKCIEWLAHSSISTGPVKVAAAGNQMDDFEEVSVRALFDLDSTRFSYTLAVPLPTTAAVRPPFALSDRLAALTDGGTEIDLFRREGEKITVHKRSDPILVSRWTPSLAGLLSLLPESDALHTPLSAVRSFFAGVRYYALEERADYKDFVTEQQYNEWRVKYQDEGTLTNSVALRLIYMWREDRELFEELTLLLGPGGLGLLSSFEIVELNRSHEPSQASDADSSRIHLPLFWPSPQMGGAGQPFQFSELSVGTRRVIRMVTSLLFDRRSLMLIEQPEDSVHCGLLRKLIDMLRTYSHRSQIIFTTHSSDVIDILRPEEVLLATASEGKTMVRELSPNEVDRARRFLNDDGSLSEFLEPFDEP